MITSFIPVFEDNMRRLKKEIEKELKRAKSDRRKQWLRDTLRDVRHTRDLIKQAKPSISCPHCGGKINGGEIGSTEV